MTQHDDIKRIESICKEFDTRVGQVGLAIARLELAKALAENEDQVAELKADRDDYKIQLDAESQVCNGYFQELTKLRVALDEAKEYLIQLLWVADDDGIHCGICHSEEYAAGKHELYCPAAALLAKLKDKK